MTRASDPGGEAAKKLKVVVYIGQHKVGSTALQIFLSQNALRLLHHDILYPCVEMQGFSNMVARAVKFGDRPGPISVNISEPHSALAYQMIREVSDRRVPRQFMNLPAVPQMMHALRTQIGQIRPARMIICSEVLSNFAEVEPTLIDRLRNGFRDAELEVYCALRRPDEYLVSWHGQRIKAGEKAGSLRHEAILDYLRTIHFDYRLMLQSWLEKWPEANFILRNYADIMKSGGSVEDFTEQVDIDFPDEMIPTGRMNPSLQRAAFEVVRRANDLLPHEEAHALRMHMLQHGKTYATIPDKDIEMFGGALRETLFDAFEPIHAYLNEVTGRAAFFHDIEQMRICAPVPELEAAQAFLEMIDPSKMPSTAAGDVIADLQRQKLI